MKKIFFILIIFAGFKSFACSCDVPKPALEFYTSDYVFQAIAVKKYIKKDSSSYNIKFQIIKQYTGKQEKKFLTLNFNYQKEGKRTSCYWEIKENQTWLIFANTVNNEITFGYNCSNSRPLRKPLDKKLEILLENGNNLDISKYTINFLDGIYAVSKPKKNIDSILSIYQSNQYKNDRVDIIVDIDENGYLISANLWPKTVEDRADNEIIDTLFNLNKPPNIEVRKPENKAEKDFLELIRNLKKWDKVYLPKSKTSIKYRQFLQFYPRKDTIKLYY